LIFLIIFVVKISFAGTYRDLRQNKGPLLFAATMSAYALPGLFHIHNNYCTTTTTTTTDTSVVTAPRLENSNSNHSSTNDYSSSSSSNNSSSPQQYYFSLEEEEKRDQHEDDTKKNQHVVGIAVKEAKVNAALLIESLIANKSTNTTGTGTSTTTTTTNNNNKQSNHAWANHRRHRRPRPAGTTESSSSSSSSSSSGATYGKQPNLSHQQALQFELAITFNGRSYTALRSIPSFEELRQALQEETEEDIPQLCFEDSMQGYSFSFLQGVLQSYVPVVERWLREVTKRISPMSSPSFRSFLWEPSSKPEHLLLHRDSSCSSQLDRIDETEMDEDTDDDDDDDDCF
jgi:hypothetical protein